MAEAWRTGCQSALDCGELALCQLRNRGREDQQDSEKPRHRLRKAPSLSPLGWLICVNGVLHSL